MPRIPLADAPSGDIGGARMPTMDAGAMSAPGRAIMGLGQQISDVYEKQQAEQKRMQEYDMRLSLEKLNTDQTLSYSDELANSAPDGRDFPAMKVQNLDKAYGNIRKSITDPELQKEADLIFTKMRGDFEVKAANDAANKRTTYVSTTTNDGITDAIKTGTIKDRASAEQYFETVIKPKIDLGIADEAQRQKLYGIFSKRLLDEMQILQPDSLLPQRFTGNSLVKAVIKNESGFDARAVSSAGAVGLMQVMPGTAEQIARELNDTAFLEKDQAQRIEYLKSGDVSVRYGTYYLNKQLARYNGDVEAALIAYNAGPGNADKWLAAGRNYDVLPKKSETQPYVAKIMRDLGVNSGTGAPVTTTQARFTGGMWDHISADSIREAQNGASNSVKQRLALGIENGTTTPDAIYRANLNDADTSSLLNSWKVANKESIAVADFEMALRTNPAQASLATADVQDKWWKARNGGDAGALLSDDQAVRNGAWGTLNESFTKAGVIPKAAVTSLNGLVSSKDEGKIAFAMTVLDSMETQNPQAFNREVPDNLRKLVDRWQLSRDFTSSKQFADSVSRSLDPAEQQGIEALEKRGQKIVQDKFADPDSVLALFDGWFSWQPTSPLGVMDKDSGGIGSPRSLKVDGKSAEIMTQDFGRMFVDAYAEAGGDEAVATDLAMKRFGRMWGQSEFAGSNTAVMKHPPENHYPMVDGSHDYLKPQLEADLEAEGFKVRPSKPGSLGPGRTDNNAGDLFSDIRVFNVDGDLSGGMGKRPDGTEKGPGWLGMLRRPDGGVSTEISANMSDVIDGKDFPLLVPTLTREEVDKVLAIPTDDPKFFSKVPETVMTKAIDHAKARVAEGKSPFANAVESSQQVNGGIWQYRLLTMPETDKDISMGAEPRYGVYLWNQLTGEQVTLPKLMRFDPKKAQAESDANLEKKRNEFFNPSSTFEITPWLN